jgi:hypothetical protein
MLVRFSNIYGCTDCTQTIDFDQIRAIGMLQEEGATTYYVRLTFINGENFTCKKGMSLSHAISYRNALEAYWLSTAPTVAVI